MKVGKKLPSELKEAIVSNDLTSFAAFPLSHLPIYGKKGKSILHYISKYSNDFTLGTYCINTIHLKPNKLTRKGKLSPLHIACIYGRHQIVKSLLTFPGTNIDLQDNTGESGLALACKHNQTETAFVLITHGACIGTVNKSFWTPLHWASKNGNFLLVAALLNMSADPNLTTKREENALHLAAESGCLETVKLLCKYVFALKISQRGTVIHHSRDYPDIQDYILSNTCWKEFPKLSILLEINAPVYIVVRHCFKELEGESLELVMEYDREDVLRECYARRIVKESEIQGLMKKYCQGKCGAAIRKLNRWQTVKKVLFVYLFSMKTDCIASLPSGLLKELLMYI